MSAEEQIGQGNSWRELSPSSRESLIETVIYDVHTDMLRRPYHNPLNMDPHYYRGHCVALSERLFERFSTMRYTAQRVTISTIRTALCELQGKEISEVPVRSHTCLILEGSYLIDLTLSQFTEGYRYRFGWSKIPIEGNEVALALLQKGYVILNDRTLTEYLRLVSGPDTIPNKPQPGLVDKLFGLLHEFSQSS